MSRSDSSYQHNPSIASASDQQGSIHGRDPRHSSSSSDSESEDENHRDATRTPFRPQKKPSSHRANASSSHEKSSVWTSAPQSDARFSILTDRDDGNPSRYKSVSRSAPLFPSIPQQHAENAHRVPSTLYPPPQNLPTHPAPDPRRLTCWEQTRVYLYIVYCFILWILFCISARSFQINAGHDDPTNHRLLKGFLWTGVGFGVIPIGFCLQFLYRRVEILCRKTPERVIKLKEDTIGIFHALAIVLVPIWGACLVVPTLELFPHIQKFPCIYQGTNSTCFSEPTNATLISLVWINYGLPNNDIFCKESALNWVLAIITGFAAFPSGALAAFITAIVLLFAFCLSGGGSGGGGGAGGAGGGGGVDTIICFSGPDLNCGGCGECDFICCDRGCRYIWTCGKSKFCERCCVTPDRRRDEFRELRKRRFRVKLMGRRKVKKVRKSRYRRMRTEDGNNV